MHAPRECKAQACTMCSLWPFVVSHCKAQVCGSPSRVPIGEVGPEVVRDAVLHKATSQLQPGHRQQRRGAIHMAP